jgi:SAM-dependent methyltransferase
MSSGRSEAGAPSGNPRNTHQETGAAWDLTAAIYERDEGQDLVLLRGGGVSLMAPERKYLDNLHPWCHRAIHLQCAGGKDTLSLWNLGAAEVVGVDISERMIASARRKSDALAAPARWYRCDILDTPHELNGTADLVYTGKGALPWMMDLAAWSQVVVRLLKPGGSLYLFEGHPLDWVWDNEASEYRFDAQHGDYFSPRLNTERWPAPYLQGIDLSPTEPQHAWERQWTLGEIVTSLADAGLRLRRFEEHPNLYWDQFPNLPTDLARRLPHTFSLWMEREGELSPR